MPFFKAAASHKPPRLVLRFAIYTGLALALAGGAILWFVRQDAIARAEQGVVFHAGFVANTILRDRLRPSDFRNEVTGRRRAELDKLFGSEVLVAGALRVKLWSPAGRVTYSNDHSLIGHVTDDRAELGGVLRGTPVRDVSRLNDEGGSGTDRKVLETSVPVRLAEAARPAGLFELYQDYAPVAEGAHETVTPIAAALGLALLALYGALFPIMRRVTRAVELRNRRLVEQAEALAQTVAARQQAETTLRESEARLRVLVEQMPAVLWTTDAGLRFTSSLGTGLQALNLWPNEVVGTSLFDYFQTDDPEFPPIAAHCRALEGESAAHELTWLGRTFETRAEPLRGPDGTIVGTIGLAFDITGRKEAEERLAAAKEQYQLVIETANDAFVAIDERGLILDWNRQAERTFGWRREEAIGRPMAETIVPVQHREAHARGLARFLETGEAKVLSRTIELTALRRDGTEFSAEVTIWPIRAGSSYRFNAFLRDVTERKRAEQALRASEERLRTLIANIPGALYSRALDTAWTMAFVSDAIEEITGYPASDFVGNRLRPYASIVHPDDRAEMESEMRAAVDHGSPFSLTYHILHADGALRWVGEKGQAIRDEAGNLLSLHGTISDITERKRVDNALRETNETLRAVLQASPLGIIALDADGLVTIWNRAAERLYGWKEEEMLGSRVASVPPEKREESRRIHERALHGEEVAVHDTCRYRKDGSLAHVTISVAPFRDAEGKTNGTVSMHADISERKRLEQERDHMEIELRVAQKLEAVGQLAAGIAHEINTPIQFVGDSVGFLKDSFDDLRRLIDEYRALCLASAGEAGDPALLARMQAAEEEADLAYLEERMPAAFERTLEGIDRVTSIVKAMKDFAHSSQVEKAPADVNEALRTTLIVARSEYKYVAELETEFGDLPPVVCNISDLNQVFLNLIVNAAHAIADGANGPEEKGTIRIQTARERETAVITIGDTGCGIPAEIRTRVFDPFFTTKEVGRGSGQGLAIARSIVVDKHGGSLTFESELGRGTTFTIRLPIGIGQARTERQAA